MSSSVSSVHRTDEASIRSSLSIEEAYRRLGHKLSLRAGGSTQRKTFQQRLDTSPFSAFSQYSTVVATLQEESYDRNAKVAKRRYADHGAHHMKSTSILQKVTLHAKQTFQYLEQQHHTNTTTQTLSIPSKAGMKRISPQTTPIRQSLPVAEQQSLLQQQKQIELENNCNNNNNNNSTTTTMEPKGLLGSLLERSATPPQMPPPMPPTKKCLTHPSEPTTTNNGRDNTDGNLIVFEGDLVTASFNIQTLQGSPKQSLKVISLLGQGTFAQVFLCQCLDSGEMVALKVVKNKQAYTRQAEVEIDVFRALSDSPKKEQMVQLLCFFMYHSHLCLVFELLGLNLYEVLKRRQFRGLSLSTVQTLLMQAMESMQYLSQKQIVHCDLKPENILIASDEAAIIGDNSKINRTNKNKEGSSPKIKLIDFGSASFEGLTSHTYIQSRFYRSPEVLVGLPYDSAIDMWSMGCVAAELFLGLPILPGVHEHDQLGRIGEMIGELPDWMMDQGSKAPKYFVKQFTTKAQSPRTPSPINESSPPPPRPTWRIKTPTEYIQSLSPSEIRKKGGLAKFEKQHTNRYFKRKKLTDIVMLHGGSKEDREQLSLFVHFLLGILDPDPWKRWTAFQAAQHPFLTGASPRRKSDDVDSIYWIPPWDPSICRRKLLNVQKMREKQQALRRSFGNSRSSPQHQTAMENVDMCPDSGIQRRIEPASPSMSGTSRVTAMTDAMSLSRQSNNSNKPSDRMSPPSSLGISTPSTLAWQYQQQPPQPLGGGILESRGNTGLVNSRVPYMTASSLGDYPPHHAAPNMGMMLMHGMTYGDMVNQQAQAQLHAMANAQSYGGMSYDGNGIPVDADFGYALQRPGVVPGIDMSGSYSSMNQQLAAMAYSPHHLQPPQQGISLRPGSYGRSGSYGGISGNNLGRNGSSSRRRRYNPQGMPESPHGLHHGSHQNYLHNPPTSIREDASDFHLGISIRSGGSSVASGSSLLSQQLEAQQSLAHHQQESNLREVMYASESRFQAELALSRQHHTSSFPMNYVPNQGVMFQQPQHPTTYYVGGDTYATINDTPLMSQSMQQQAAVDMRSMASPSLTHNGYDNRMMYGAPSQMLGRPVYGVAPTYLAPPTLDELERAQHLRHQQYQGQLQQGDYRGLSM